MNAKGAKGEKRRRRRKRQSTVKAEENAESADGEEVCAYHLPSVKSHLIFDTFTLLDSGILFVKKRMIFPY